MLRVIVTKIAFTLCNGLAQPVEKCKRYFSLTVPMPRLFTTVERLQLTTTWHHVDGREVLSLFANKYSDVCVILNVKVPLQ